jgi:uncharacterized membrane protein/peroxiredoxin
VTERALRWLMALALVGVALSLYLTVLHVAGGDERTDAVCELASWLSCNRILASGYASVGPVPVAAVGAAGFAILFALALWRFVDRGQRTCFLPTVLFYGAAVGFGFDAALTVAAAVALGAACPLCLIVLGLITASGTITWRLRRLPSETAPPSAEERARRRRVAIRITAGGLVAIAVLPAVAQVQTAGGPPADDPRHTLAVGEAAPRFEARDLHGLRHRLDDYVGKRPVLIEFMWTFCRHCRAMAPTMRELAADHHADITILSIAGDPRDRDDLIRDFVEQYSHGWPYLVTDAGVLAAYGVTGYPTFVTIDTAGRVRSIVRGEASRDRLEEAIRAATATRRS